MRSFNESQRFNQPFFWIILVGIDILVLFQLYNMFEAAVQENISYMPYVSSVIIISLFTLLFYSIKLETQYDERGITYRFYPIMFNYKNIPISQITSYEVKDIHPLSNFGGWGYRWKPNKLLLNTRGDYGIVFNRTEGKQITLGTQQPEKVKEVMRHLIKKEKDEHYD